MFLTPGGADEAIHDVVESAAGWIKTQGALDWLARRRIDTCLAWPWWLKSPTVRS
jgi:hypothetical protein